MPKTKKDNKAKELKRLEELKNMLLQEKANILRHSNRELNAEGGMGHGDMADVTTAISEREHMLRLAEHEMERLRQIEEALEMADSGQYGLCSECGEHIPDLRLKALPTAHLCLACQSLVERRG